MINYSLVIQSTTVSMDLSIRALKFYYNYYKQLQLI